MRISLAVGVLAAAALLASPAAAEDTVTLFGTPVEARPGDPPSDAFGLGLNTSVIQVSQWKEVQSGVTWSHGTPGYLAVTASTFSPNLYAPLTFDAGVEITQVCARVMDSSNTLEAIMTVAAFESGSPATPPAFMFFETVTTGAAATPGFTLLCATVDPVIRIRTDADVNGNGTSNTAQFWVGLTMPVSPQVSAGPAIVTWRRTLSPAPGVATFADVPTTHAFFRFVEALAASGITGGCGGGNFCPDTPLTRGQMSVFLAGALGLHWPN
jgi:hypothetical protein